MKNISLILDKKSLAVIFSVMLFDDKKVFQNKELIENNPDLIKASKDNCDLEEFIAIIKDINLKIEDVVLELKEYDTFLKTKEQMKKDGEKQNCFDTNIDMSKVMDLSKITLIRKKRKEPTNNDDDIKKPEEDSNKKQKFE